MDDQPISLADQGYFARLDVGNSTSNTAAAIAETDDSTTERLTFTPGGQLASDFDVTADDPLMFTDDTEITYTLLLTMNVAGNIDVLLSSTEVDVDDNTLFASSVITPTTSFDTLYFGGQGDSNSVVDFRFDNVLVTSNVPEPASALLLGLGGLFMGARRKRDLA